MPEYPIAHIGNRLALILAMGGLAGTGAVLHAAAQPAKAAVVHVDMLDATSDASLTGPQTMKAQLDTDEVPPGPVTFLAHNLSKGTMHEMIVAKVSDPGAPLPMDKADSRVIESKIKRLGEIEDLKPGQSGKMTRNLGPGSYVLLCNQPGHYHAGMWAVLTVKR